MPRPPLPAPTPRARLAARMGAQPAASGRRAGPAAAWAVVAALLVAGLLQGAPVAAQGGAPVTVAVLDSGIDADHAELSGKVAERHSFAQPMLPRPGTPVPGLPNPFDEMKDPDGQGTGVASRVAGATLGVAPDARLVDLQVSGRYTQGVLDPAAEAAAAEAMDWLLVNHGAASGAGPRVALLSFASRELSGAGAESLAAQAQALWDLGVLVVVPGGGQGTLHGSPYVVTVGASDLACDASAPADGRVKPDLAAPGKDVQAARPNDPPVPNQPPTVARTGTAYAAAAVAGAAARMWAERPDLPVAAVAAILRDSAQGDAPDGCLGWGVLDVEAAVQAARTWSDPVPDEPLAQPSPAATAALAACLALAAAARRRR